MVSPFFSLTVSPFKVTLPWTLTRGGFLAQPQNGRQRRQARKNGSQFQRLVIGGLHLSIVPASEILVHMKMVDVLTEEMDRSVAEHKVDSAWMVRLESVRHRPVCPRMLN